MSTSMKIQSVAVNNHKKAFEVKTRAASYSFPFAKAVPLPDASDLVAEVQVDPELGREGFVYRLESGKEGTVHIDQVLDYNRDSGYLRDLILYRLTLEVQKGIEESPLSKREIIRRLGTSASQFYRIVDQTNYKKTVDQLLKVLYVLDCDVEVIVRRKSA